MAFIHKFEKLVLALILGLIAPILGLLILWWGALPFLAEALVPYAALGGLLLGALADVFILRRFARKGYQLDVKSWTAIHLFYSAGIFGVFMGMPVFNALLALPAGFVAGGRLVRAEADDARVRQVARRTAEFTTLVLALVCAASALIALVSPSTASDLEGMLGLDFEVTQVMILGLILIGGAALLAFNWLLTVVSVRFSHTFLQRKR
jgi:uncharacterized membrane protein